MTTTRFEVAPKSLLLVVATIAGCWLVLHLLTVLLVLVVALFLVGTLNPGVNWLEQRGMRRSWGITFVFTILFVSTLLLASLTLPTLFDQARSVLEHEPEIRGRLADLLARSHWTAQFAQSLRHVHYDAFAKDLLGTAVAASTRAVETVAYLFSAVFLALYMMIDRDRLRGGLFAMVPRSFHIRLSRVLLNLETIVGGYIRGQALTSGLMAAFVLTLLTICGVPNALAVAVFAGLADVLPYIGVVLSVVPVAAAASTQGVVTVIVVVAVMLAYEELESRVLVPRIYGHVLRLPSSMVLLALLVGGTLLGITGALLALPVAAATRMLIEELRVVLPGEHVDDDALRERDERAEQEYARRAEGVPAARAAAIAAQISEERIQEIGRDKAIDEPLTGGRRS